MSGRRGEAPSRTLWLLCASVSLLAFHYSASGRLNKPLMRNGCYSCPSRYFCAITIYHICLSTILCPLGPPFFFSYGRHCSVLFTTTTSACSYFRSTPIGRLYDVDDETTYPVRHAPTFRPNAMPTKVADRLKCRKLSYVDSSWIPLVYGLPSLRLDLCIFEENISHLGTKE